MSVLPAAVPRGRWLCSLLTGEKHGGLWTDRPFTHLLCLHLAVIPHQRASQAARFAHPPLFLIFDLAFSTAEEVWLCFHIMGGFSRWPCGGDFDVCSPRQNLDRRLDCITVGNDMPSRVSSPRRTIAFKKCPAANQPSPASSEAWSLGLLRRANSLPGRQQTQD